MDEQRYIQLYDERGNVTGHTVTRTGELVENVHYDIDVPEGTRVILDTPEDRERRAQQRETRRDLQDRTRAGAHFIWIDKFETLNNLQPETRARLIQLCCYMDYNERGAYLIRARHNLTRADMRETLRLSQAQTDRTLASLSGYIETTEEGYRVIANGITRGQLQQDTHNSYTRININSYNELYNGTDTSKHKYIGYVFSCLPYINTRYNVLCYNPDERDLQRIEPISKAEFCEIIGYRLSNLNRLSASFHAMTIHGVQAVCISGRGSGSCVSINPDLIYSGDMIGTAKAHHIELMTS